MLGVGIIFDILLILCWWVCLSGIVRRSTEFVHGYKIVIIAWRAILGVVKAKCTWCLFV